jgi:hypothetical protein
MSFVHPDILSIVSFIIILIGVVSAFWIGAYRTQRGRFWSVVIGTFAWLGLFSAVVASGWVAYSPFPRLMILFAVVNVVTLLFSFSDVGKRIAFGTPLYVLAGFQVFRFPLELVLHSWALQGVIPMSMTWNGSNLDIIGGIAAGLAWMFGRRSRPVIWGANVIGFVLLMNVMRVAILSSPLPFSWDVRPMLLLGFYLPYALIVPVCVAGALAGHVILTRALLRK